MSNKLWGWLIKASPIVLGLNLFILISPFIDWRPVVQETTQKLYFVFGVFALFILSLFSKPKRYLTDRLIALFALWALFLMFWHSQIWDNSLTYRYLNFYLMSEGFIHVFAGILLYKLVFENVDRLPAVYFALAMYLGRGFFVKSLTPIFAVAICSLIWCVIKKKWVIGILILILAGVFVAMNMHYIALKWQARAFAWPYTIEEIMRHPITGFGFDKNLMSNLILSPSGWIYRHNDFLNIVRDLGLPALIMIGLFVRKNLDIFCLGVLIICCAQTSFYWPRFAVIGISLFALRRVKSGF